MEVIAKAKFIRVSPKKLRRIANLIRGRKLDDAISIVKFLKMENKKYFKKILDSVFANAKIKNPDIHEKDFFIKKLIVNEGPRIKRMKPRARGRADVIRRRISHIEITISDDMKKNEEDR